MVRTQPPRQLVKLEEAPASVTPAHALFPTFHSGSFSCQHGKRGLELPCRELRDASGCPPSQPPCSCQPGRTEPEPTHLLSTRFSPGAEARGQHAPYARCPGPLLSEGRRVMLCHGTDPSWGLFGPLCMEELLPSLSALKKKENNSIMFLTKAILHWCQVLLSSLLLASYDRATELDPSPQAHRVPLSCGYGCYQKHGEDGVTSLYSFATPG